ncbi:MAG: hypothetical protein ACJ768_19525 [Gaiellaceae bacterium]
MKLSSTVPPHARLVRTYGGDQTVADVEHDAQLLVDAGLTPHIVSGANGYALFRDETADEQIVEIARENRPRRRDRSPDENRLELEAPIRAIPADAPHDVGTAAPRVRE